MLTVKMAAERLGISCGLVYGLPPHQVNGGFLQHADVLGLERGLGRPFHRSHERPFS